MAHARPSVFADVFDLMDRLRPEDERECQAAGTTPYATLYSGLEMASRGKGKCFTIVDGKENVGMFGASHFSDFGEGQANVWLLATPRLVDIQREFMRQTRPYLTSFHQQYPLLWNWVDSRNTTHVRWLRFFGFNAIRTETLGGVPFHEFVRIDPSCVPSQPASPSLVSR